MSWSRIAVIGIAGVGSLVIAGALVLFYLISRDTTIYAPDFSEEQFSMIKEGMKVEEVKSLLGEPLSSETVVPGEAWIFGEAERTDSERVEVVEYQLFGVPVVLFNRDGSVVRSFGSDLIHPGMLKGEVSSLLGRPTKTHFWRDTLRLYYSEPHTFGRHEARIVGFDDAGIVTKVYRYTTYD